MGRGYRFQRRSDNVPARLRSNQFRGPERAPRLSIVVLPFADLGDNRAQQYFADGMTDDLTTDLSRIANISVISRSTAFTYRDRPVDAKQVGRELGCVTSWKGASADLATMFA